LIPTPVAPPAVPAVGEPFARSPSAPPPRPPREPQAGASPPLPSRWRDVDVLVALSALWIVSVVRVVGAGAHHEVFGAEATLAFLSMFAIPWIVVRGRLTDRAHRNNARPSLRLVRGTETRRRRT
jgi:hypothetical protein